MNCTMMPLYILRLPLPHRFFSQNTRIHWAPKARETAKYRYLAELSALNTFKREISEYDFKPYRAATIKRVFFFNKPAKRDADNFNARCKSLTDGVRDSGLLVDDDEITWLPSDLIVDKDTKPRLEYHFFKLEH